MLGRERRLRSNDQFKEVLKRGRSYGNDLAVLYVLRQTTGEAARFGVSVPRRFGGAVARNRTRRLFWQAYRLAGVSEVGYDAVLLPRTRCQGKDFAEVLPALRQLCRTAGLMKEEVSR